MSKEIKIRKSQLPVKIEHLQKWILIGTVKLKAQIAAIKAIDKIEEGWAAKQAALSDTQDLAEELLYAEAKLGEMLEVIPDFHSAGKGTMKRKELPSGITKKDSFYAQQLARNEQVIAEVIVKAREKGEVPIRGQVLRAIQENRPKPQTPELPKGIYDVIYADPPWKYSDELIESYGAAEHHYRTMTIEELCNLDIKSIIADNAVLFLWVTSPLLDECWPVIDAWGFQYATSFVWDKVKHNYGHYNSVRHELLLICTKGSYLPQNKRLFDSVQTIERSSKHSEKPEQFRKIIETMYPVSKKIELFARSEHKGWAVYGNEIP